MWGWAAAGVQYRLGMTFRKPNCCFSAIKRALGTLLSNNAVDRQNAAGEDPAGGNGCGDERRFAGHLPFPGA